MKTNPYEGGSDHSVFLGQGVPALLAWPFPDWFYHTNLDRPDKTSPAEMKHAGVCMAATTWFLASASDADARLVVKLIESAAKARLTLEQQQGALLIASAADRAAAQSRESQVRAAWIKWYSAALRETLALPTSPASAKLQRDVEEALQKWEVQGRHP